MDAYPNCLSCFWWLLRDMLFSLSTCFILHINYKGKKKYYNQSLLPVYLLLFKNFAKAIIVKYLSPPNLPYQGCDSRWLRQCAGSPHYESSFLSLFMIVFSKSSSIFKSSASASWASSCLRLALKQRCSSYRQRQ